MIGVKSTIANLQEINTKATKTRARLHQLRTAEVESAQTAADTIKAKWKDQGVSIDEKGIRTDNLGDQQRRKFVEVDIKTARTERLAKTAEERAKLIATLGETRETLALVRRNWANPVGILMTKTLASDTRATYTANLAHAGPYELENTIRVALQNKDQALAAACLVRYDAMDRKTRDLVSYGKDDVAEAMVHDEWSMAVEAIGLADYAIESGELAEREMRGDKISPDAKIRVGMRLKELSIKIGRPVEGDGSDENKGDGQREGESFEDYLDRKYPGRPLPAGYTIVGDGATNE
jgi:hypothetical protein